MIVERNLDEILDIQDLDDEELFELLDVITVKTLDGRSDRARGIESDEQLERKDSSNSYCGACKSGDNIVEDPAMGIVICNGCGNVVANLLDENPEWRQYDDDGPASNGRCTSVINPFLPQTSLGTTIGGYGGGKLKLINNWGKMPYKERSLNIVLKDIQSKCEKNDILKCIEHDAKILYHNISECKHLNGPNKGKYIIIRGKNRRGLIAACVYFACKKKGHTRSIKEIAKMWDLKYTEMTRGCKTFLKLMKIKKMDYEYNISNPEQFVPRFCRELNISKHYVDQTVQIVKNVQLLDLASMHTPTSIATGAILIMSELNGLPITKKMITKKFNISEVTVNKALERLNSYKKIILNTELTMLCAKKMNENKKTVQMPPDLIAKFSKMGYDIPPDEPEIPDVEDDSPSEYDIDPDTITEDDLNDYIESVGVDIYNLIENTDSEYNSISELIKSIC
jgi:transcription initiation factor TFIIB